MNSLRHTVTEHDGRVLLALAGDLDFAAHATLVAQLDSLIGAGKDIVVDCSGLTFMDSMGLRALVEGLRAADGAGLGFELTAPSAPVLRVLELSGTAELFRIGGPVVPEPGA